MMCDVHEKDNSGNTPLIWAIGGLEDKENISKALLEKGADPHAKG